MNARVLAVVVVAFAAFTACYFESREGTPCDTTNECDLGRLECIPVDGDGVCLPIVEHDKTTCSVDADCADALFPIEAACEGGLCRCRLTPCSGAEVVDREHCACVESEGGEGDFCNDDDDCGSDATLHCEQSTCTAPNRVHDSCNFSVGCADGFQCSCTDGGCVTFECLVSDNGLCSDSFDCASGNCDDFDFDGSGTCA